MESGDNNSSPGSRFKVDITSNGVRHSRSPSPPPPPPPESLPPQATDEDADVGPTNGEVSSAAELLTPLSKEGELSVPIIELPDGKPYLTLR